MPVKKTVQKKTSQKKSSQKKITQKKSKVNTELVEDFTNAYANAIVCICRTFVHKDNGDEHLEGSAYCGDTGGLVEIYYQAGKSFEGEINNAHIILEVDENIDMNCETYQEICNERERVDNLLLEDFNEMYENTNYDWYRYVDPTKIASILDLTDKFHQSDDNCWKFSFEPTDDPQGHLSSGWIPTRVKSVYAEVTEDDYQHNRDICVAYGYESDMEEEEEEEDNEENNDE